MKRIFILFTFLWINICAVCQASTTISDVAGTDIRNAREDLLLLTDASTKINKAVYLSLRYFPSYACSGDPIAETQVFDKASAFFVKQGSNLKFIGAAVYSFGAQQVGDDGMSQVSSIAVRLGAHLGENNAQDGYFYIPELAKYTKSYCIRNVVCANYVCQSIEHFSPQVAFTMSPKSSKDE